MQGTKEDRFPLTYQRAATSIVQCRSHLTKAEREVNLAIEIISCLDPSWEADRSSHAQLLEGLTRFRERLAETLEAFVQQVTVRADDSFVTVSKGEVT